MGDVRTVGVPDADSMVVDEIDAAMRRLLVDEVSGPDAAGFALPTGTVSFLLTDVEGSSQRWEPRPQRWPSRFPGTTRSWTRPSPAMVACDRSNRARATVWSAAFARASDAVAAAVDAQRAFLAESWPTGAELHVRMAVHTGEAQLRDEGNYFGQTVIRCARLRAIGHGDQILVSDAAAGLVLDQLPDGVILADLGTHRLKDLGRPERVWHVVHPTFRRRMPRCARSTCTVTTFQSS